MEIDLDKIDDTVLGLLWLTLHDERRAWKGFDWGALIGCIKRFDRGPGKQGKVCGSERRRTSAGGGVISRAVHATSAISACPLFQCKPRQSGPPL